MAKKASIVTVEEKLRSLYDLQLIDSKIDEIRATRGELPKEVENLELEIGEIEKKANQLKGEMEQLDGDIAKKKLTIKDSEAQIKRFEKQLNEVKNNREYEALTKEIEFQNLEIELANKRINEYKVKIENKREILQLAEDKLKERSEDLAVKTGELDTIIAQNEKKEQALIKLSDEYAGNIEDRLLQGYRRIRNNSIHGLAVVPVINGAIQGSYFMVPPQRELDIRARKKIIISEHCGRILVDEELANEESEKIQGVIKA